MADDINWKKTHCGRMDHGGCALLVGVKDNQIVDIKGDPDGYLNRGYICAKGRASAERLNHPQRLRHPLRRRGERGAGKWDQISWPQAITIIRDNFNRIKKKEGARAVAFCQGMPKGLEHFVLIRLANIFGSPNVVAVQDVCHAPREISGFHTYGFYPVADYHYPSQVVMLWGSNITATNEEGQICSRLLDQIRQGTELIVIDPRKTALAARARYWLQLKPGTDMALALTFLNVAIEEKRYDHQFVEHWTHGFDTLAEHVSECTPERAARITGVPADLIRSAAGAYASASPAAIGWGNAIEHNRQAFDTCRALVCLMAVCGNLDIPGGNIQANEPDILSLGRFVRADLIPNKKIEMIHARQGTIRGLMTVPPTFFKKAILDEIPYPVRGAYMQCTNPLLGYADSRQTFKALQKLTFLAVADIHMTPTAAMADVVLPAATHFEFDDIGHFGLGHGHILARPRVVDPPPGCWPDIKILNELGKALTGEEHWYADHSDLLEAVLEPCGIRYDAFCEQGFLKGDEKFRKYETDGFRTPTGKVELLLSRAEKLKVSALPRFIAAPLDDHQYPLMLTCSKDSHYLHSSYRWLENLRARSAEPIVVIHPQTAAEHSIRDGNAVYIETRNRCITQFASLSDAVLPQVVYAAYGWWFPEDQLSPQFDWQTANYNILTTTENLGREFGTPNLKGIPCRIRRK